MKVLSCITSALLNFECIAIVSILAAVVVIFSFQTAEMIRQPFSPLTSETNAKRAIKLVAQQASIPNQITIEWMQSANTGLQAPPHSCPPLGLKTHSYIWSFEVVY